MSDKKPEILNPDEYRLRIGGKGTGVQINIKVNTELARRIINFILLQESALHNSERTEG